MGHAMRVLLAAVNAPKGEVAGNLERHLAVLERARADGCEIAVFPTGATWWSPPGGGLHQGEDHLAAAENIRELRWWSAGALRCSGVVTTPRDLAGLLDGIAGGRLPDADTDLGV